MHNFNNKTYTEDFPFLAIGDIHDETSQLKSLIFHISNSVHRDYHLIFLGDYFEGTQRFGELLRLLRSIKDRSDFILGNHIFVDTGCGYGGYLSAFIFPEHITIKNESSIDHFV